MVAILSRHLTEQPYSHISATYYILAEKFLRKKQAFNSSIRRKKASYQESGNSSSSDDDGFQRSVWLPWYLNCRVIVHSLQSYLRQEHTCQLSCFFHSSIELIFTSVQFLHEISPTCPAFLVSMYNTFILCPAMSREIQRCVPLL